MALITIEASAPVVTSRCKLLYLENLRRKAVQRLREET